MDVCADMLDFLQDFKGLISGVRERSFRGGTCHLFPSTFLSASETERNTLRNFEMKRLFRNAFSERSMSSEK